MIRSATQEAKIVTRSPNSGEPDALRPRSSKLVACWRMKTYNRSTPAPFAGADPCEEPGEEDEQDELIIPLAGVSDVEVKGDGQFATGLRVRS